MVEVIDVTHFRLGLAGDEELSRLVHLVDETCCQTGFLLVKGHGLPLELIGAVCREGEAFFQLPQIGRAHV